ncbi:MAG TPA: carbohydrate binding domain-containing protein [Puia sp.]|nr:carbohydrate binding domain-containing protein [Puia sp.]
MKKITLFITSLLAFYIAKTQLINNGDFETGNLSPWYAWNPYGTSTLVRSNSHTGNYALAQSGGETSVEQVVSNLQPNTTYTFETWAKLGASGQIVIIGVKNYGGSEVVLTASDTVYAKYRLSFTTGASNTRATLYFYKPDDGQAYGDDFTLYVAVSNPGFETAGLSPWYAWNPSGTSTVTTGYAHSGSYAVSGSGGETSIEQVVTGLLPGADYTFEGWVKVGAPGQSAQLGVKNYGGPQATITAIDTAYTKYQVSFTMGDTSTQATVFFYTPDSGAVYGDDLDLYPAQPTISPGNTTYYIDNVNGRDTADGKSPATAWQTLGKVNQTNFSGGDSILFNSTGAWTGTLSPKGSGSAGNPVVISSYGGGSTRPILNGNGALRVVYLTNQQYWEITNLEITNPVDAGKKKRGIEVEAIDQGKLTHIYIRNNYLHDVLGDNTKDLNGSLGILVAARKGIDPAPSWFDTVKIENNIIRTVNRTGIGTASDWWCRSSVGCTDGTAYIPHTNVAIRNNYVENAGGDGIVPEETLSAVVEYNLLNGANTTSGEANAGIWAWNADSTLFQFNEVYNVKTSTTGVDGQAYDVDYGQDGTIYQYNYSHDNAGGFMLLCSPLPNGNSNAIVRYNISQNDNTRLFHLAGIISNAWIYNNTFYLPEGSATAPIITSGWNGYPAGIYFINNLFYLASAGSWIGWDRIGAKVFDNNLVYGKHTSGEPSGNNNLTADPQLLSPGRGAVGSLVNGIFTFGNAEGYKLKTGSPALHAGKLVTGNGGHDYWGNPVSSAAAPNIGAYNGSAVAAASIGVIESKTSARPGDGFSGENRVFPSPVNSGGNVNFSYNAGEGSSEGKIEIYSSSGQLAFTGKLALVKGTNWVTVKLPPMNSGLYIAILSESTRRESYRILVTE